MISKRLFFSRVFQTLFPLLAEHLLTTNESSTFRLFFLDRAFLDFSNPIVGLIFPQVTGEERNRETCTWTRWASERSWSQTVFAPRHARASLIREVLWPRKPYNCATRGSLARGKVASPLPLKLGRGRENIAAVKDREEAAPARRSWKR